MNGNKPITEIIEDEDLADQTREQFAETIKELGVKEPKLTRNRCDTSFSCQMYTDAWQDGPVLVDIYIEGQTLKLHAVSPADQHPTYNVSCDLNGCKARRTFMRVRLHLSIIHLSSNRQMISSNS